MQDIYDRKLSISLTAGYDDDGKEIIKTKTFSNVRLDTTDEELSHLEISISSYIKSYIADYRML